MLRRFGLNSGKRKCGLDEHLKRDDRCGFIPEERAKAARASSETVASSSGELIPPAVGQAMIELDRSTSDVELRVSLERALEEFYVATRVEGGEATTRSSEWI